MNFTDSNFLLIIIAILAILLLTLIFLHLKLRTKLNKFLIDIKAENIADSLNILNDRVRVLDEHKKSTSIYLEEVEKRLQKSIQSVHTIRFNPFHGTGEGGNQSFATVFLNEQGDGAVISSIYTRDRVSVFSKGLKNFSSEHGMSEEEIEAIKKAREILK